MLKIIVGGKNLSSWSLRAWLAIKKTGAQFEEMNIPFMKPDTKANIRKVSPSAKVPVLVADDVVIWDSMAICEFLAEKFPAAGLWPEKKEARAIARSVAAEMHSGFLNMRKQLSMNCNETFPDTKLTPETETDVNRVFEIWKDCRKRFGAGGPFLFGSFTIADCAFAPVVLRFRGYNVEVKDQACRDYMKAVLEWPAMKEWLKAAADEK